MPFLKPLALASLPIALVATPALAGDTAPAAPAAPAEQDAQGKDPNRTVCKKIEVIGSRLQAKRVCRTAAEWDAQSSSDRQSLERSQTQRWKSE